MPPNPGSKKTPQIAVFCLLHCAIEHFCYVQQTRYRNTARELPNCAYKNKGRKKLIG